MCLHDLPSREEENFRRKLNGRRHFSVSTALRIIKATPFPCCKGFGTRSWNKVHKECLQWLAPAVETSTAEHKVVVTHHCPYISEVAEHYVGRLAGSAYMVDVLPMFANSKIDHWIHGHVHVQMQCLSSIPQIHSNPMGYVDDGENREFRNDAVIGLQ